MDKRKCTPGVCLEKCLECNKKGLGCCDTAVPFKDEELAKVHFENSLISEMSDEIQIVRGDDNYLYVVSKEDVTGSKVVLSDRPCVFFDGETYKCKIYDHRPEACRKYGEVNNPCIFTNIDVEDVKNIELGKEKIRDIKIERILSKHKNRLVRSYLSLKFPKIKKFSKKDLKNMKEEMLLYLVINAINLLEDKEQGSSVCPELFEFTYKYQLVMINNTQISSIKLKQMSANHDAFKGFDRTYNILNRKFVMRDPMYLQILVGKLKRVLSGVEVSEIKEIPKNSVIGRVGEAVVLLDLWKTKYKNKSNSYKGIINEDNIYKLKKWINKELGSESLINPATGFIKLYENGERIYKAILKQK